MTQILAISTRISSLRLGVLELLLSVAILGQRLTKAAAGEEDVSYSV